MPQFSLFNNNCSQKHSCDCDNQHSHRLEIWSRAYKARCREKLKPQITVEAILWVTWRKGVWVRSQTWQVSNQMTAKPHKW
jgi:hypothetical protein